MSISSTLSTLALPPKDQISKLKDMGLLSAKVDLATYHVDELIDGFLESVVGPRSRVGEQQFARDFPAVCLCEDIITALINPHEELFLASALEHSIEWELLRTCARIAIRDLGDEDFG